MSKKINSVLREVLEQINPSDKEISEINKEVKRFVSEIEKRIRKARINAEVFIGGSFAKKTIIKKDIYDADLFIRFNKSYENRLISEITEKILEGIDKRKIHGSRDYFKIKINNSLFLEVVPVKKIRKVAEAENITDLSYFHASYIKKKIKDEKIINDIKIAKAFCHANGFYGAESYINGFSGYALELLIYHYGSFLKFIKSLCNEKRKIVIDIEKQFKTRQEALMDINASKLKSPIILVDPTYKYRNVLAALSHETFEKFQKTSKEFLMNPDLKFFKKKGTDFSKIRDESLKKGLEFVMVSIKTSKQEGGVAGSKLLKFYRHLRQELDCFFDVKFHGFEYYGGKNAVCFFAGKNRKEIAVLGPKIEQKNDVEKFKKAHKKTFSKSGRIYAREKIDFMLKKFIQDWAEKHKKKIKDMSISGIKILD